VLAISFGEALWLVVISFLFITYLMMLFSVIIDLFRDRELGGFAKAIWAIALIVFPLVTMLVYLIARGKGMAERSMQQQQAAKQEVDTYIREVAGGGAASELARASELRDKGALSEEEYAQLKARILA
jgi:ABC-type multidrug transport system fused ATPase/permease subunit